jgi:hypothetical protein
MLFSLTLALSLREREHMLKAVTTCSEVPQVVFAANRAHAPGTPEPISLTAHANTVLPCAACVISG